MSVEETARPAGPVPQHFAGQSFARSLRRLFHATRPKFFPASVLPVLAGTAWGFQVSGQFEFGVFLLALIATVCIHAGANVLNDVGDDLGGTDRQNEDRIYPYTGGSQFIQSGIMSPKSMANLGIGLLGMAAVAGMLLLLIKGATILWFGIAGLLLAVLYSLGPIRLSATGFGELSVGIAFGVLPVTGAAWLQSGVIDTSIILFSLPISAWVAAILLINEVPDVAADGATGKRTLPVRLGLGATANSYLAIQFFAAAIVVWLVVDGALPMVAPLVPIALLVLACKAAGAIRRGIGDRKALTAAIESTLGIHSLGSIWLAGLALFVAFWASG